MGAYVPRVPSIIGPILIICIGVVALLIAAGNIQAGQFWIWYGHRWPLLLIAVGLAMLGEWALDLRRSEPVRRGGNLMGLLILMTILGLCAAAWNHAPPWITQMGDQKEWGLNENFFKTFGLPAHDNDQLAMSQQIPANSDIKIENPRGDVSITASEGSTVQVQAHEVAYAGTDIEARRIFEAEAAHITVSPGTVLVGSEMKANGHVDLVITVPKNVRVTVDSGKGEVTADGLGAGFNVNAQGNVHLSAITGPVKARFTKGNHDFSIHDIRGNLDIEGDCNDLSLSEVTGNITQNGEIFGDVHIENLSGSLHLHTSATDLELAKLPGDLALNSEELRVSEAHGAVRVVTHSKDVDLSHIYGESYVEDRDGRISIEPAGPYAVSAKNSKGDIEVTLPPGASAIVNARTRNGDILTDFSLPISGDENKSASGRIGSGGATITLSADNGDVRIKKGSAFPAEPSLPAPSDRKPPMLNVPPYHRVPDISKAPHLKPSTELPLKPFTQ
jgi:DUF4097 and DUF4098 domain-containing protein YvlB